MSSACVQEGYPSFMPPLRAYEETRSTSFAGRAANSVADSSRLISALPIASPLWQPPLFLEFNWLLDPTMYTGGAAPSNERSGIISFIYSDIGTFSFFNYFFLSPNKIVRLILRFR